MKRLFISYSRADKEYVKHLVDVLREQEFEIWFDEQIPVGKGWDDVLEEQIKKADAMVLVLSQTSVASENVKDEIAFSKHSNVPVIPIKIEECDVPLRMVRTQFIDFTLGFDVGAQRLVDDLRAQFEKQSASSGEPVVTAIPRTRKKVKRVYTRKKPWKAYIIGAAVAILIPFLLVWMFDSDAVEDTSDDPIGEVSSDEATWAYTVDANTLNIYTDYLIEFKENATHYDEARQRIASFMDATGYVPMDVDGEMVMAVEAFNKNKNPEGYPLPDNVIYPLKTVKVYELPVINGQSAVLKDEVLVKDQPVIVLDIEQDNETLEVWVKIAYQQDY
ncbi:TIR domain-containing protein [Nonlabens agnitus]|uniref:TIR domain-containing protein n=1 Tax=Nonlabens agnitus TaxID=870484 RepID=A0A2S9WSP0_9FLAO|nr:TIR domain-containing protein [Nonlabens agnitus]PRP66497.1 hypothetical protein BST86_05005 [Nonlabens agnitus]